MGGQGESAGGYAVPTYRAPEDTAWYHFLHGNVPGHQIDFMYRPEIPQGLLTRQHFSHLERLIKYIEPHTNTPYAFAIGNLSRDDTQYEPGHGGLGMIFGFRIQGVTDHAGRQDPPFAHGIATVDRNLDAAAIFEAARSFYDHLFSKSGFENPSTVLYQEYVRFATKNPSVLSTVLKAYIEDFGDLPALESSGLTSKWLANEAAQPKRVVVVHPNDAPFRVIAQCAARIAAMLYQSNIKWSAITNGRESDLPGGVTVRFVAKRDAGAYESGGLMVRLDEVPKDDAAIAEQLFGARSAVKAPEAAPVQGWRARMQAQGGSAPTSTPPPPMTASNGDVSASPIDVPDSGVQEGRRRIGEAHIDSDRAPAAPSSKKGGDLGARPWSRPREGKEAEAGASEHATGVPALRADVSVAAPPVGSVASGAEVAHAGGEKRDDAPVGEPEKLEAAIATPAPPRSRAWIWIGLALLCAAMIPIVIMVTSEPEAQPDMAPKPSPSPEPQPTGPGTAAISPAPTPAITSKPIEDPGGSSSAPQETTSAPGPSAPEKGTSQKGSSTGKQTSKRPSQPTATGGTTEPPPQPAPPKPGPAKTSEPKPDSSLFNGPLAPLPKSNP
ncbi:MAG: hypothetical protein HUU21_19705 [Polyangiaceae bacterium]|nr:hypothetical protein [Polyangiaceae bacterium]